MTRYESGTGEAIRLCALLSMLTLGMFCWNAQEAGANTRVPAGTQPFMSFPSSDTAVIFGQAWYYEATGLNNVYCSYSGSDVSGYGRHCAIDYSKRSSSGTVTFPVTAVADGKAYRTSSSSGKVYVLHDAKDASGRQFCTKYVHLNTSRISVPIGASSAVRVKQGEVIAWAGKTGTSGIHLHLETKVGGCSGAPLDPYDIAAGLLDKRIAPVKAYYPRGGKFAGCGPNPLWLSCDR